MADADLSGELAKGYRNHEPRKSTSAMSIASKNSPREGLHDSLWTIIKAISAFNKRETGIMIFGLVCSILAGGGMPVQGVLFAKCIISLSLPPAQYPQLRTDINFWSLMYLAVALAVFLVSAAHGIAFGYCSERL